MKINESEVRARAKPVIHSHYLYFLLDNLEIVYVGQTKCVESRVQQHLNVGRVFDSYSSIDIYDQIPNEIEADYIVKFNPRDNRSLPKNDKYIIESKAEFETTGMQPVFERNGKKWFKSPENYHQTIRKNESFSR